MTDAAGGGASRSTDPAAGSSAATDVSLREFLVDRLNALDRHLTSEIASLQRETATANANSEKAIEVAREESSKSIQVAKEEASERLKAHNGLIEQMRQQATLFASREVLENFKSERQQALEVFKDDVDKRFSRGERFQAMLTGGMILVSFIGVANLIKIWSG